MSWLHCNIYRLSLPKLPAQELECRTSPLICTMARRDQRTVKRGGKEGNEVFVLLDELWGLDQELVSAGGWRKRGCWRANKTKLGLIRC